MMVTIATLHLSILGVDAAPRWPTTWRFRERPAKLRLGEVVCPICLPRVASHAVTGRVRRHGRPAAVQRR